jgi:hypothetical protein
MDDTTQPTDAQTMKQFIRELARKNRGRPEEQGRAQPRHLPQVHRPAGLRRAAR